MKLKYYSPRLNPVQDKEYWFKRPDGPKPEMKEREPAITVPYDELIRIWKAGDGNNTR
jgi:hypothetical protein